MTPEVPATGEVVADLSGVVSGLRDGSVWGPWFPLRQASRQAGGPGSGLYRIRRHGRETMLYIGQSGGLRRRMGHLMGAYAVDMPFRDPHTAAPAVWAFLQTSKADPDVSFARLDVERPDRMALECVAVSLHRMEFGASPAFNFGRMPPGYVISSQRRHGRRGAADPSAVPAPSSPQVGSLDGGLPSDADWGGLKWSPWAPLALDEIGAVATRTGLYRLRLASSQALVYVGQGILAKRLRSHRRAAARSDSEMGRVVRGEHVEMSWVEWTTNHATHLLEVENDLIASHVLTEGRRPAAQFLGKTKRSPAEAAPLSEG